MLHELMERVEDPRTLASTGGPGMNPPQYQGLTELAPSSTLQLWRCDSDEERKGIPLWAGPASCSGSIRVHWGVGHSASCRDLSK